MSTMDVSVVLRLIDQLTGPAKNAAKSMENLQKTMEGVAKRSAPAMDAMPKSIKRASDEAKRLTDSMSRIASAATNATSAVRAVGAASSSSIGKGSSAITTQTNQLNALAKAAKQAATAVNNVGRGRGGGGGGNGGGTAGGGGGGGGSSGGHGGGGILRGLVGFHLGARAVHGVGHGLKAGMENAFNLEQTKALLAVSGQNDTEIAAVVQTAKKMALTNKQFSVAQHAHAINEMRSSIGDLGEALQLAPAFQKTVGVLNAVKDSHPGMKNMETTGMARDFARALEIKGVMQQGEHAINSYMNSMTKAIVAYGGQLNASDFHQTFKYGRAATRGWSQEFTEQFLPTIMNELKSKGGSSGSAGNALMSMHRAVVGGVMTAEAAQQWSQLDLFEPDKIKRNKKGKVVGVQEGGVKGWEMFISDPYKWTQQVAMPAIKKAFPEADEKKMTSVASRMFGNRVAESVFQIMMLQGQQFEKDAKLVRQAMGFDALSQLELKSPQAAMQRFKSSFDSLMGSFAGPWTDPALRAMRGIADAMDKIRVASDGGSRVAKGVSGFIAGYTGQDTVTPLLPTRPDYDTNRKWRFGMHVPDGGKVPGVESKPNGMMYAFGDGVMGGADAARSEAQKGLGYRYGKWLGETHRGIVKGAVELYKGVTEGPAPAFSGAQSKVGPTAVPSVPGMLDGKTSVFDPKSAGHWFNPWGAKPYKDDYTLNPNGGFTQTPQPTFGGMGPSHLSDQVQKQLQELPSAAVPNLSDIGTRIMQSIADGLSAAKGVVTQQMSSLMGELNSIAGAGVNIPVRVDTGGVSGQVQGAIQAASAARPNATVHAPTTIKVEGGSSPRDTARAVHTAFADHVGNHLNDIG